MRARRWLGVDFSGDHRMWRDGCRRSNVWVAVVEQRPRRPALVSLLRVQALPGEGPPFGRLLSLLGTGDYEAAGVDAPFSVPAPRVHGRRHGELLLRSHAWNCEGRPFPSAATLVAELGLSSIGRKEYRETERTWVGRVNVRSTTWAGARGGAAMTAACLRLLANAGRPIWPWTHAERGLLAEAFPAAQLHCWKLPWWGYNGGEPSARDHRQETLDFLGRRIVIPALFMPLLRDSADALDAVLCAFAAIGVTDGALASEPGCLADPEGWIAVHE